MLTIFNTRHGLLSNPSPFSKSWMHSRPSSARLGAANLCPPFRQTDSRQRQTADGRLLWALPSGGAHQRGSHHLAPDQQGNALIDSPDSSRSRGAVCQGPVQLPRGGQAASHSANHRFNDAHHPLDVTTMHTGNTCLSSRAPTWTSSFWLAPPPLPT